MTGRKPKPTEHLRIAGTLRPHRHAGRANAPNVTGKPRMPVGLSADARWMWKLLESLNTQGTFAKADAGAMLACCDLWAKYRTVSRLADANPLGKQECVAVRGYFDAWFKAAAVLGLNPLDRLRLRVDKPKTKRDPDDEFFESRA